LKASNQIRYKIPRRDDGKSMLFGMGINHIVIDKNEAFIDALGIY